MKDSASNGERKFILPRSRILRGRESIQLLFRTGRIVRDKHMDLRYLLFPGRPDICLMGFIAGKRLGKAHERNLIKRRMRETYRMHQFIIRDAVKSDQIGFHGIFIAKKADTSYPDLDSECKRILHVVRTKLKAEGTA